MCIRDRKYIQKLLIKAKIFGISLIGDGATVKRMPLINIISSGVYFPVAVLAISDCTNHMAECGTKTLSLYLITCSYHILKRLIQTKTSLILLPLMAPQKSKKLQAIFKLSIISVLQFMVVSMLSV